MEITDIKIRKILPEGRLKAIISVTVDNMLAIHDVKVVQGDSRLFVAMPSRKDENGLFRDIVHPISASSRKLFEESILDSYEKQITMLEIADETEEALYGSSVESDAESDEVSDKLSDELPE